MRFKQLLTTPRSLPALALIGLAIGALSPVQAFAKLTEQQILEMARKDAKEMVSRAFSELWKKLHPGVAVPSWAPAASTDKELEKGLHRERNWPWSRRGPIAPWKPEYEQLRLQIAEMPLDVQQGFVNHVEFLDEVMAKLYQEATDAYQGIESAVATQNPAQIKEALSRAYVAFGNLQVTSIQWRHRINSNEFVRGLTGPLMQKLVMVSVTATSFLILNSVRAITPAMGESLDQVARHFLEVGLLSFVIGKVFLGVPQWVSKRDHEQVYLSTLRELEARGVPVSTDQATQRGVLGMQKVRSLVDINLQTIRSEACWRALEPVEGIERTWGSATGGL